MSASQPRLRLEDALQTESQEESSSHHEEDNKSIDSDDEVIELVKKLLGILERKKNKKRANKLMNNSPSKKRRTEPIRNIRIDPRDPIIRHPPQISRQTRGTEQQIPIHRPLV